MRLQAHLANRPMPHLQRAEDALKMASTFVSSLEGDLGRVYQERSSPGWQQLLSQEVGHYVGMPSSLQHACIEPSLLYI
jgi:hypothetical protein